MDGRSFTVVPVVDLLAPRIEQLELEELRSEDEKRYIDMTPAIFVFVAVAMAIRYISLGLVDQ